VFLAILKSKDLRYFTAAKRLAPNTYWNLPF